jgi:hypothetical protein
VAEWMEIQEDHRAPEDKKMMQVIMGFILGAFVGCFISFFVMSLFLVNRRDDR